MVRIIFVFVVFLTSTSLAESKRLTCLNGLEYGVWGNALKSNISYVECKKGEKCVRVEGTGKVRRIMPKIDDIVVVRDVHVWQCMSEKDCETLECNDRLLGGVKTAVEKNVSLHNFTYDKDRCKSLCCNTQECNSKTIHAIKRGATLCLTGTEFTYDGTTHQKMTGTGVCYNKRCYRSEAQGTVIKNVGNMRITKNVSDIIVYGCSAHCGKSNELVCDWNTFVDIKKELDTHDTNLTDFVTESGCITHCCEGDDCNRDPLPYHASQSRVQASWGLLTLLVMLFFVSF